MAATDTPTMDSMGLRARLEELAGKVSTTEAGVERANLKGALATVVCANLPTILSALEAVEWRPIEALSDEDGDVLGWAAHSGFGLTFNFSNPWATHWRPLGPAPEVNHG